MALKISFIANAVLNTDTGEITGGNKIAKDHIITNAKDMLPFLGNRNILPIIQSENGPSIFRIMKIHLPKTSKYEIDASLIRASEWIYIVMDPVEIDNISTQA